MTASLIFESIFFYLKYRLAAAATAAKSLRLCPTLCDPIDGSPLGSPIPGILQASNTNVCSQGLGGQKGEMDQ